MVPGILLSNKEVTKWSTDMMMVRGRPNGDESVLVEALPSGAGRRGRGRFSASLLDSVHGEVAEVEAELVEATAGLGVAGVDGEVRGTAAGRRRSRERLGSDLDPEKRGAGDGERESSWATAS